MGFFLRKNVTNILSFLPFVGMAMDFPDLLERLLGGKFRVWGEMGWGFFLRKNVTNVLSFLSFVGTTMDFPDLLE